ncbi:MAG: Signal transduction protein [uncultured Thiotrichaceae bacterium]|uniref:Signal transduction protein n=1 Tax=uncultured Thiotrichaceae bacterium TaxID=298394 RepID=A0A6S6T7Z7_9GAMM|nr:MAG: Signal transduction protein [uncultured Thiotrichaceae bacterium]
MSDTSLHVRHHMNPNFVKLKPDQEIGEVITLFNKLRIFGAPVVDDLGNLVGMISGTDCIEAAVQSNFDPSWRGYVKDFMTEDVRTVDAEYSCLYVAKMFLKDTYRRYPVIEDNRVIGQVGRVDILRALENATSK